MTGIVASCEIDLAQQLRCGHNLQVSSQQQFLTGTIISGEDENKVILFHCGPVAD